MCGIFGFIEKQEGSISNKQELLENSTNLMIHRGPDDEGYFLDSVCGLGMRRLSIIDLAPDLYPFISEDGSKHLIFNGEIYNYTQLREELSAKGYQFKTNCDAEVIIHGFEEWGVDVLQKLSGMFAIAIWDARRKELFLARDRIGIKPLYFINDPKYFFFSSEVKPFLSPNFSYLDKRLDENLVQDLLGFMFLPHSDKTIIKRVHKLSPGSYMLINKDSLQTKKYWSLGDVKRNTNLSFDNAVDHLDELLNETVASHLLSDVPVGVLLSGGLDSSLLTAIAAKNKTQGQINTFTARFDHKFDESAKARAVAKRLNTNHTELFIDTKGINTNIEDHIHLLDDLSSFDGGIFSTKLLCEQIRKKGIKVLLLGEGADEIFGGYSWFGLSQLPFSLLPSVIRNALYYYAISRNLSVDVFRYLGLWNSLIKDPSDTFSDITRAEVEAQLPNHLLMKVDKGTMSSSIEARVPYLDHKVVEFAYALPRKYKLKGSYFQPSRSNEKYILREVAKRYLPNKVAMQKKKGFLLPMKEVLYADIDKVKHYVLASNSISSNIFSNNFLESLFSENTRSIMGMQKEYFLWRIFMLEVWAAENKLSL